MTTLIVTFALDIILTLLLAVTISFCWKLNTRIRILQDSKSELAQLIRQFDESTERATHSIVEIQNASKKITESMQTKLQKANYLADDLHFMIEKGTKIADQLEGNFAAHRGQRSADRPSMGGTGSESKPQVTRHPVLSSKATPDASSPSRTEPARPSVNAAAKATASLESVLERVSNRAQAAPAADKKAAPNLSARVRSKAEQELLEAIKSGRS